MPPLTISTDKTELDVPAIHHFLSTQSTWAIGIPLEPTLNKSVQSKPLGNLQFVYAVAPHHPLASAPEPVTDAMLMPHRAVAVADSVQRGSGITSGLLGGQDIFTVPGMQEKLDAQLRGLGGGFLPEYLARPHIATGRLVEKQMQRPTRVIAIRYAWRCTGEQSEGRALQWWLQQLAQPATRQALLERPHSL